MSYQFIFLAWWSSLALLVMSFVGAFALSTVKYKRTRFLTPINMTFIGTFLSAGALFFPIYIEAFGSDVSIANFFKALFMSVQHAFRVFALDGEYLGFIAEISDFPKRLYENYAILSTIIYVIAPFLSFTFVLSFFKNLKSRIRFSVASTFKNAHVFSELNEKSLALAKSIMERSDRELGSFKLIKKLFFGDVIVFTDIIDEQNEQHFALIDEAREIGAILFRKDMMSINLLRRHSLRKNKLFIYLISLDEAEKMRHATEVMTQYDMPNVELYVFSENVQSQLLLGVKSVKHIKVVRVNDIQTLIYHNLDTYGVKLFKNAVKDENGISNINAVIVGFGRYGRETAKALTWFCQIPGYRVNIDIFDTDPLVEDKFTSLCPELMKRSGLYESGEAEYRITFHNGTVFGTTKFTKEFNSLDTPTYIFVGLGKDNENIEAAIGIRSLCEKCRIYPDIETVVYDSNISSAMSYSWDAEAFRADGDEGEAKNGITNHAGQEYKIHMFGALDKFYSADTVIKSEWENAGEAANREYAESVYNSNLEKYMSDPKNTGNDPDSLRRKAEFIQKLEDERRINLSAFWNYEYNYRASVTRAIHESLKKKLREQLGLNKIFYIEDKDKDLTDTEKAAMLLGIKETEHKRWNAYMRTEGFSKSDTKNALAKEHCDLKPFGELDKYTIRKDKQTNT